MSSELNYDEIRRRVKRRYDNHAEFLSHLVAFVVTMFAIWALWHPEGTLGTFIQLGSAGWFMGLVIHFIQYLTKIMQERAIDREIERERAWRSGFAGEPDVKRKRDRLTLSDDGEVLEVIEDDEPVYAGRRNR